MKSSCRWSLLRVPQIVGVQEGQISARGPAGPEVSCGRDPAATLSQHREPRPVVSQSTASLVRGPVIDDDQLVPAGGLRQHRLHGLAEHRPAVVGRDDDADEQTGILRYSHVIVVRHADTMTHQGGPFHRPPTPSPSGRGLGATPTAPGRHRPPLPLGEGWGEGTTEQAARWERQGKERPGLLGCPHPAFGHPLPEGEGLDLGRNEATLSQRERGWMRHFTRSPPQRQPR